MIKNLTHQQFSIVNDFEQQDFEECESLNKTTNHKVQLNPVTYSDVSSSQLSMYMQQLQMLSSDKHGVFSISDVDDESEEFEKEPVLSDQDYLILHKQTEKQLKDNND